MKSERETFKVFKKIVSSLKGVLETDSQARLIASRGEMRCPYNKDGTCPRLCENYYTVASINLALSLFIQAHEAGDDYSIDNIQTAFNRYLSEVKRKREVTDEKCKLNRLKDVPDKVLASP